MRLQIAMIAVLLCACEEAPDRNPPPVGGGGGAPPTAYEAEEGTTTGEEGSSSSGEAQGACEAFYECAFGREGCSSLSFGEDPARVVAECIEACPETPLTAVTEAEWVTYCLDNNQIQCWKGLDTCKTFEEDA